MLLCSPIKKSQRKRMNKIERLKDEISEYNAVLLNFDAKIHKMQEAQVVLKKLLDKIEEEVDKCL